MVRHNLEINHNHDFKDSKIYMHMFICIIKIAGKLLNIVPFQTTALSESQHFQFVYLFGKIAMGKLQDFLFKII